MGWPASRPGHFTHPVPIVQEAGWAPGPVWTGAENLAPQPRFDPPDRPARSESLCRLSYPGTRGHHFPLNMKLCGPRSRSVRFIKEKYLLILAVCEPRNAQLVVSIYTECPILAQMWALELRRLISTFGWALTQTVGRRLLPVDVPSSVALH
jgi:hypothetical protein